MEKTFKHFYILSLCGVTALSFYPLYMGAVVLADMVRFGAVDPWNYPKYVIPYTPVCLAVLLGTALTAPLLKRCKRGAFTIAAVIASAVFFISETCLEKIVIAAEESAVQLENWQMYLCAVSPAQLSERGLASVDILTGAYDPAFKIHFYVIALLLILSLLNVFYGFGDMLLRRDRARLQPLVMQAVSTVLFLSLCIFACFTAFFRTGELQISPLSAALMNLFFIVMGLTAGLFVGSFTLKRKPMIAAVLSAAAASLTTVVMYIGEMILLGGNLYRFGTGFLFNGIPRLVLAPIDVLIILLSGMLTAALMKTPCNRKKGCEKQP